MIFNPGSRKAKWRIDRMLKEAASMFSVVQILQVPQKVRFRLPRWALLNGLFEHPARGTTMKQWSFDVRSWEPSQATPLKGVMRGCRLGRTI